MYLWIKAFHLIAVISWMAGMLYLPRLFVYHCAAEPGSQQAKTFEVMEHRLLTYIMTPAMGVTWILGIVLVLQGGLLTAGWLHAKLVAVVAHDHHARAAEPLGGRIPPRPQPAYAEILSYYQ